MADFSNAKVGDKVYCIVNGWGVIDEPIKTTTAFPVCVKFSEDLFESYLIDGRPHSHENANPILYHSKPTIIEAKRMVKKEVNCKIIDVVENENLNYNSILIHSGVVKIQNGVLAKLTFEVEE